ARAYSAAGRYREAEPLLRDVLARYRAKLPGSPPLANLLGTVGFYLLEQSKWLESEPILRECLAIRETLQPDDWLTFNTRSMLGRSLLGQGKYAEAEPLIVSGYDGMKAREQKIPGMAKNRLGAAADRIVRLYEAWGKPDEADKWRRKVGLTNLPDSVFTKP